MVAAARDAIDAGVSPASPDEHALAQRWLELFRSYAGDDPATQLKFRQALMTGTWADETPLGFVREVMRHLTQPH
ncbi:hypothetical protein WS70_08940 [Burkholderia mayonis]|uniref:MerR family transcriptional regulator n=1 Tax=Burkholderia mayonis TaxID=1385591 RepID=A0A1B4FE61_9BURK|nr:hypothetical protein WS70_08940 [Burkholderia mayonis]